MRIVSAVVDEVQPKLTPPAANDTFFYTAGRMLTYNKPTKNGLVFFREDCLPVLDTLQSALSDISHVKLGNKDVPDPYDLKNAPMGSIFKYAEDEEGIDIICKNDKKLVQGYGFSEKDFSTVGRFSSYSQESAYSELTSPYISVPMEKAKGEFFSPSDVIRTYSYDEAQALGLYPSRFDMRSQKWRYCLDPAGNPVFIRLKPESFTGVGQVLFPADDSAEVYRYTASAEGQELVDRVFGGPGRSSSSALPGMDDAAPDLMGAALENPYLTSYQDDMIQHPEISSSAIDMCGEDLADNYEADETGRPVALYIPDADDIWLNADDLNELKNFSFSAAKALTPGGNYADPGYQADKKKRYPLNDPEHIGAAAVFWARARNKSKYSPTQRAAITQKIQAAERKHKIGQHANSSYAAVWTSPHPDDASRSMVNRRFKMVDENQNLDRNRLVSSYQALSGIRGATASVSDMPQTVRDHALALVRQGLKLTKQPNKELSMSSDLNPHITAELEELREKARALSQEKETALAAKDTEIESLRQEFSQFKTTQEALLGELKAAVAEKDGIINEYKSRELSQARMTTLETVHPFSEAEKADPKFGEFVQSLSSISEDRMETLLVRRELEKVRSDKSLRTLSHVSPDGAPRISPSPTFEGELGKSLKISSPTDVL